jgi:hypothetical protein
VNGHTDEPRRIGIGQPGGRPRPEPEYSDHIFIIRARSGIIAFRTGERRYIRAKMLDLWRIIAYRLL